MYKFEIHLHTNACSACGISTARQVIDAAKEHGYSGVVFTNHFYHGNTAIDRKLPWSEFVKPYIDDFEIAKLYGETQNIVVLFGLEEVYEPGKEMLLYAFDPECIRSNPKFVTMTPEEISDYIHSNGGIVSCAHPFRDRAYIPYPDKNPEADLFDAVEVYNFCNKPEENQHAIKFAKENNLRMLSGGDVHDINIFGHSGIAFKTPVTNNEEFKNAILSNNYKLIINDKIVNLS